MASEAVSTGIGCVLVFGVTDSEFIQYEVLASQPKKGEHRGFV